MDVVCHQWGLREDNVMPPEDREHEDTTEEEYWRGLNEWLNEQAEGEEEDAIDIHPDTETGIR